MLHLNFICAKSKTYRTYYLNRKLGSEFLFSKRWDWLLVPPLATSHLEQLLVGELILKCTQCPLVYSNVIATHSL